MEAADLVLIVDDDQHYRAELRRRLSRSGLAVAHGAPHGPEAENLARLLRPQAVLVALREPLPASEHDLAQLREVLPSAVFIAYSASQDPGLPTRAARLGVHRFIRRGREEAELADALHGQEEHAETQAPHGQVVTVAGMKGGIGRTTVAANLAAALAFRHPGEVLLVDLAPRIGDAALAFGLPGGRSPSEAAACLESLNGERLRAFARLHPSGVHVLAGRAGFDRWTPARPSAVRTLLRRAASVFRYVVVDTPGAFDDATGAALRASDRVLVVTNEELASLRGAGLLLEHLAVEARPGRVVRPVFNHTAEETLVTRQDALWALGLPGLAEVPFDPVMPRCAAMGRPMVLHNPASPAAAAFDSLARWAEGAVEHTRPAARAGRRDRSPREQRAAELVPAGVF